MRLKQNVRGCREGVNRGIGKGPTRKHCRRSPQASAGPRPGSTMAKVSISMIMPG